MDDGGGASPDCYGGGGGGGSTRLVCESCELADYYSPDDFSEVGFLSCRQCDYLHIHTQETAADPGDYFKNPGGIRIITQPPKPCIPARDPTNQQPPSAPAFNESDEPRDFVTEPEALGARVRQRYVQGMQVILQRQLEALVERHRVGALVCGVAGTLWVRWVAASKVFDEMWARKVLTEDEALHRPKLSAGGGEQEEKFKWADEGLPRKYDRRRVQFFFLRSLRTTLPLYSTFSVCFLACHITREAVLPTDIYRWAMEGKLPYMAAFTEVDELLGTSPEQHYYLNARQLFRPVRVIGVWKLEAAAGSIARRIGLRLPSVNFYAIAQRYLNELSLPVERILPHACRIYEWAMPAELWLSSNPAREIFEAGRNAGRSDPGVNLPPSMKPDGGASEEFGTRELLCTLADAYDKIDVAHDYSKDLHSYLQYCKDVVFPGIACSKEEKHLMEIFLDMYEGREDENPKEHIEEMRNTDGVNKRSRDGTCVGARCFSASSGIRSIKSEMEDHGFCYMPPRKCPRSDGYLYYRRKTITGSLVCAGHADYYVLIRSFAKLAEVDIRIMHTSVLKLERRLACIEGQICRSLDALQNLPSNDEKTTLSRLLGTLGRLGHKEVEQIRRSRRSFEVRKFLKE